MIYYDCKLLKKTIDRNVCYLCFKNKMNNKYASRPLCVADNAKVVKMFEANIVNTLPDKLSHNSVK